MWSRKFSPTAGSSCFTSMPCCFSSSGWPMPESSRICGLAMPPADRIVSFARACTTLPSFSYSTPTQRLPSSSTRRVWALVTTCRFFERFIAGSM